MQASSDDSEPEEIIDFHIEKITKRQQKEPDAETVRKCIDLIQENKQLKMSL